MLLRPGLVRTALLLLVPRGATLPELLGLLAVEQRDEGGFNLAVNGPWLAVTAARGAVFNFGCAAVLSALADYAPAAVAVGDGATGGEVEWWWSYGVLAWAAPGVHP